MKSILNPSFRYVPSASTDISKTFDRERRRLKQEAERREANEAEASTKVKPLVRAKT